ncbi:regulatory protein SipA [Candidatus Cyanaurora vandensis]|uniref:regulatory protein SipA n=1 Tax=Candidatus Cyanaurora vandensis TaxID=2714958 RepID=UPI00257EE83A|nr:DUF3148 domain-containing protein [Candidatus Cyanaurora vandensis]
MTEFTVGQKVRLVQLPPYVKTAETMPMLRPASVLTVGEEGVLLGRNPGNYWAVRFSSGAYLLEVPYLAAIE